MISNSVVRKVVQVEYAVVRTPLALVDRQLSARLGVRSKLTKTVDRGLQRLDSVAGRLLSEPPTQTTRAQPTRPDADDADSPAVSDAGSPAVPDAGSPAVPVAEVEAVAEVLLNEEREQPHVGELADPDLQEVQARLRAKHLLEEREEQKRGDANW